MENDDQKIDISRPITAEDIDDLSEALQANAGMPGDTLIIDPNTFADYKKALKSLEWFGEIYEEGQWVLISPGDIAEVVKEGNRRNEVKVRVLDGVFYGTGALVTVEKEHLIKIPKDRDFEKLRILYGKTAKSK